MICERLLTRWTRTKVSGAECKTTSTDRWHSSSWPIQTSQQTKLACRSTPCTECHTQWIKAEEFWTILAILLFRIRQLGTFKELWEHRTICHGPYHWVIAWGNDTKLNGKAMLVQYIACIIKLRLACPEFSNLQQLMLDLTLQRKRLVQIGKAKLLNSITILESHDCFTY